MSTPLDVTKEDGVRVAEQYLLAVQEAGAIYQNIADAKGADNVIAEISMDETSSPQAPPELLVILAAIADEGIPVQTIAPKFTGRFNKGVDDVGGRLLWPRRASKPIFYLHAASVHVSYHSAIQPLLKDVSRFRWGTVKNKTAPRDAKLNRFSSALE